MTKNRSSDQSDSRGGTYQRYGQRRQPPEYRGNNDSRQRDSRGRDNRNDRSTPRFNTSRSRDRYGRPHPRNRTGSSYRGRVKSGDRSPSHSPSRNHRQRSHSGNTPYYGRSRESSNDRGRNRSNSRHPTSQPRRRSSNANVSFEDAKKKDAHKDKNSGHHI